MNVLVLCPQGGQQEAEFNASIADAIRVCRGDVSVHVATLRQVDANTIRQIAPAIRVLQSFEEFCDESPATEVKAEALRLAREYPQSDWWSVAIAERNLVDSSFLLGGAGEHPESQDHVESLIVNMARYFEAVFSSGRFAAVVGQVADSLLIHVFYQVARRFGVRAIALSPNAWIREDGKPGFYIGRDEFIHCGRMEDLYHGLIKRELSDDERQRVARYKLTVSEFNVVRSFQAITKRPFIVSPISPNLKRLWSYLRENAVRRREIEYYKIDVAAKTKANLLRVWRRLRSRNLLGSKSLDVPEHSVFYPMQYQPEQTTLVGGLHFANQISTIENIAKCIPFGYTVIVKEHPRGRGARPAWQYRHLARFPNIRFCDADTKEIMKRCKAVITITSTAGLEAMALDKPIVVLGNCYYDFADVVYKPKSWPKLAQMLRRILIDGDYDKNTQRDKHIDCFFLAYLLARRPVLLSKNSAPAVGQFICDELGLPAPAPERLARAG
jgi:Capsule polysaccharide biosynthesis protein